MITPSNEIGALTPSELEEYGYARARDIAFDAVMNLLRRREAAGVKDRDIAKAIGWSPSRFSRSCRGPGNWTMRTLGALVVALNGELQITVRATEDPASDRSNYDAYDDYRTKDPFPWLETNQKKINRDDEDHTKAQASSAGL